MKRQNILTFLIAVTVPFSSPELHGFRTFKRLSKAAQALFVRTKKYLSLPQRLVQFNAKKNGVFQSFNSFSRFRDFFKSYAKTQNPRLFFRNNGIKFDWKKARFGSTVTGALSSAVALCNAIPQQQSEKRETSFHEISSYVEYPQCEKMFIEQAKNQITSHDQSIILGICRLIEQYPEAANALLPAIIKNFQQVNDRVVEEVLKKSSNATLKDEIFAIAIAYNDADKERAVIKGLIHSTNKYVPHGVLSAATKQITKLSKHDLETAYYSVHGTTPEKELLKNAAFSTFVLNNRDGLNRFVLYARRAISAKDFHEHIPSFIAPAAENGMWLYQLADADFSHLTIHNFNFLYYRVSWPSKQEEFRETLRAAAVRRFGNVATVDKYQDIKEIVKNSAINLNALIYYVRFCEKTSPMFVDCMDKPWFLYEKAYNPRNWSIADLVDLLEVPEKAKTVSGANFDYLYEKAPKYQQRIRAVAQQRWGSGVIDLITAIEKAELGLPGFLYGTDQADTQSDKHFFANIAHVLAQLKQERNIRYPSARNMLIDAYKKEREEKKKGNSVFYHGRQWKWDFIAHIYKELFNVTAQDNKHADKDFVFLRFDGSEVGALCLNYSLFANATCPTSSTAHYVIANHDYSGGATKDYATEHLFKNFGLQHYYAKYKDRLDALEDMHEKANKDRLGSLLMVSVPEHELQHVFPAKEGSMGRIVQPRFVDATSTANTKEILRALHKDPRLIEKGNSDYIEFGMRFDPNYILNPYKGPRIYSFDGCDKQMKQNFEEEKSKIFSDIARDVAMHSVTK